MTSAVRIFSFLCNATLVLLALGALGSFFPGIPILGELGPILTAQLGLWGTILASLGSVVLFRNWRASCKRRDAVMAGLALFVALGTAYVHWAQISLARGNGIRIELGEALLATSQEADGPKPVSIGYNRFDGDDLPLDIYRPDARFGGRPAPVFVYIHGGGWGGADPQAERSGLPLVCRARLSGSVG